MTPQKNLNSIHVGSSINLESHIERLTWLARKYIHFVAVNNAPRSITMKKFINEIENDLQETIEEVCKYKGEFLKNLRKASKNISSFKQKMMSGEN